MLYKAVLAGSTGLIGHELLQLLLEHPKYNEVLILVRKPLAIRHNKLQQCVIDFEKLRNYSSEVSGRALFCCLGSTRKKTPDLNEYHKIDHDYPLELAKIASENKMEQYHLISSLGADASSGNFYTEMKGETENDVKKLNIKSLHIYQPSFLDGNRQEKRPVEKMMIQFMRLINPLLIGPAKKYRSISAIKVAQAMLNQSLKNLEGQFTYPSDIIQTLA